MKTRRASKDLANSLPRLPLGDKPYLLNVTVGPIYGLRSFIALDNAPAADFQGLPPYVFYGTQFPGDETETYNKVESRR
jgi:hypothetical protein